MERTVTHRGPSSQILSYHSTETQNVLADERPRTGQAASAHRSPSGRAAQVLAPVREEMPAVEFTSTHRFLALSDKRRVQAMGRLVFLRLHLDKSAFRSRARQPQSACPCGRRSAVWRATDANG